MTPIAYDGVPLSAKHPSPLLHRYDIHLKYKNAKVAHEDFCVGSVAEGSLSQISEALDPMGSREYCDSALSGLSTPGASSLLFIKLC